MTRSFFLTLTDTDLKLSCNFILILGLVGMLYACNSGSSTPPRTSISQETNAPDNVTASAIADAAEVFLSSLSTDQLKKATVPFTDAERKNWHFFPQDRAGLPLREMDTAQKEKAMELLRESLSSKGLENARDIMKLEEVLHELEAREEGDLSRNSEMYYLVVFGEPGFGKPWGWRMEGHHLSLNYTSVEKNKASNTPSFWGANPGNVPSGTKEGLRILKAEEDLGRKLVKNLSSQQLELALINEIAPNEMVTFVEQKVSLKSYEGIAFGKLTPDQQTELKALVSLYLGKWNTELAPNHLEVIEKEGWDSIYFGWAGGVEFKEPHYYRIHGPRLLIEYDNVQNGANHIHTVVRDPLNDFGEDMLRRHLMHDH